MSLHGSGAITALVGAVLVGSCAVSLYSVMRERADDLGDGYAVVRLPRPISVSTHRARTFGFFAVSSLICALCLGPGSSPVADAYRAAVAALATSMTGSRSSVNGYLLHLYPAAQILVVASFAGLIAVIRAPLSRRVVLGGWLGLYLVGSISAQALLITLGYQTGLPFAPYSVEGFIANVLVGSVVFGGATFSTFVLPKRTLVPKTRPRWFWDTATTLCVLLVPVGLLLILYSFVSHLGVAHGSFGLIAPIYSGAILTLVPAVILFALSRTGGRPPEPSRVTPRIDVIVPAFNEGESLAGTLQSIDKAAGVYAGPVHVIVSNDGSTDDTLRVAIDAFALFQHATGEILTEVNGGKSAALNRALARSSADIVVRLDGDCFMGKDALLYSQPWFSDPDIGCVGAVMLPREDLTSWFARLRVLECLFQFVLSRQGQQVVDGIVVVPGTFTAFRRELALAVGGFAAGMNGEDADLTMQIGRIGRRVVIDPRVRAYEDVPATAVAFLEQRTRWGRGGLHVLARHNMFRAGCAGPRVWYWMQRRLLALTVMLMVLVAPSYGLLLLLLHPVASGNILEYAFFFALSVLAFVLLTAILLVVNGRWRDVKWLPAWPLYSFLRRVAMLEALISLPVRPIRQTSSMEETAGQHRNFATVS